MLGQITGEGRYFHDWPKPKGKSVVRAEHIEGPQPVQWPATSCASGRFQVKDGSSSATLENSGQSEWTG